VNTREPKMETPATATASTPMAMIPVRPVNFMRRTITRAVDRAEARIFPT